MRVNKKIREIFILNSLQILRGIAAWMVVFHHIVQSYFMGKADNIVALFFQQYGAFGVDIFFVLSGVVMALTSRKYEGIGSVFGINRVFRLVPTYWFYTVLLVVSILLLPSGTYPTWWEDYSLLKSLLLIPNPNPNGSGNFPTLYVGWTLIYEMFFYLIFTLSLMSNIQKPAILTFVAVFIIALLFKNTDFLGHSSLLLIEFAIGILIFEYLNLKQVTSLFARVILPCFLFSIASLILIYTKKFGSANFFIAGLIVYVFILMETIFSIKLKLFHYLKLLGDYSYSTYLSHTVVIGWFYFLLGRFENKKLDIIAVACISISVLLISRYSYQFIEKSTYVSTLKRRTLQMLR